MFEQIQSHVDDTRGSVLLAFKGNMTRPVASLYFGSTPTSNSHSAPNVAEINNFIMAHKFPIINELTPANYQELYSLPSRPLLVLAALDPATISPPLEARSQRHPKSSRYVPGESGPLEYYRRVAEAWTKKPRGFQQPVHFVWTDGIAREQWLKQNYGSVHKFFRTQRLQLIGTIRLYIRITAKDLPAVVIVDPAVGPTVFLSHGMLGLIIIARMFAFFEQNSQYFDVTLERTLMTFDGNSIFSGLEGVYQHWTKPRPVTTSLERSSEVRTLSCSGVHCHLTRVLVADSTLRRL